MEQKQNKNSQTEYGTNAAELMQEMKAILSDFFICDMTQSDETLLLRLPNGQTFGLQMQRIG